MERVQVKISGLVQGVMFRAFVQDHARNLGLVGRVRNLRDGRVETVAEGEGAALERLVEICRKGPPHARVTGVDIEWLSPTGEFKEFAIAY